MVVCARQCVQVEGLDDVLCLSWRADNQGEMLCERTIQLKVCWRLSGWYVCRDLVLPLTSSSVPCVLVQQYMSPNGCRLIKWPPCSILCCASWCSNPVLSCCRSLASPLGPPPTPPPPTPPPAPPPPPNHPQPHRPQVPPRTAWRCHQ
jgi:hypothetical protein